MLLILRKGWLRLWIPLILLWPIILALAIVLIPVAFLLLMLTGQHRKAMWFVRMGPSLYFLFASLRGLTVDVQADSKKFYFALK